VSDPLINRKKQREFLAAVYEDLTKAERLLKSDPQFLHYRSGTGETAFHYLIIEGERDRSAKLLKWGANINTQDAFGGTPLMHAVMLKNLGLVKWLVENGADLDLKNENEETALALATSNEAAAIFQFLIAQPRKHSINYYYDDFIAYSILTSDGLVMKDYLISLGLTERSGD
jgi:ankyrin repeat protein